MVFLHGKIDLRGANPTHVRFGAAAAAEVVSTNAEPFDMTDPGDGGTIIANPDGDGNQTATINATAGYLTGGSSASTDMTTETDTKIGISVNGGDVTEVEFAWAACDSGSLIAAQMQTKIRALGGDFASVTVVFSVDHYVITSPTLGTSSAIAVTNADDHDCADELDLTTEATATAGTGDVADLSAVTAAEIIAVCEGDMSGIVIAASAGAIVFRSDSTGNASSVVIGDGTFNTVLGLTGSDTEYGAEGLGYDPDDLDVTSLDYCVAPMLFGTTTTASKNLGAYNPTALGFDLYCETAGCTDEVRLIIELDD